MDEAANISKLDKAARAFLKEEVHEVKRGLSQDLVNEISYNYFGTDDLGFPNSGRPGQMNRILRETHGDRLIRFAQLLVDNFLCKLGAQQGAAKILHLTSDLLMTSSSESLIRSVCVRRGITAALCMGIMKN